MFQNSKFDKLNSDVFSKINGGQLEQQLKQLYDKTKRIINKSENSGKYTESRLYKEFCNGNELKLFRRPVNKIKKTPKYILIRTPIQKDNNIGDSLKNTVPYEISEPVIQNKVLGETPVDNESNKSSLSKIMNDIKSLDNNIYIDNTLKTDDYYSNAFFGYISKIFNIARHEEKQSMLKNFKLDIITKFNKENYYKDYDYSLKHFKKSFADETFTNNDPVTINMLKIYGDILNVNIVHLNNRYIEFITKFNKKNATFIFNDNGNTIETLMTKHNFIRGDMCSNILNVDKIYKESDLSKLKLDQLQNIAKMLNLNIKKPGKTGKINIKKDELIKIICNK